jgi:hypothetical protein
MRALSKHFAKLGLPYASVHNMTVDATKGCLTPSAKRLSHLGFIFQFASAIRGKAPSVRLTHKSAYLFVWMEG